LWAGALMNKCSREYQSMPLSNSKHLGDYILPQKATGINVFDLQFRLVTNHYIPVALYWHKKMKNHL